MGLDADTVEAARRIGVKFAHLSTFRSALTHPSWTAENGGEDYQRLEFLGDSVLGSLVAEMLYRRFPELPEGDLTRMKWALVRGTVLADVCDEMGLTEAIRLGEGSERTGVRSRASVRAAVFEAVVAAVYLDAGVDPACDFVTRALGGRVDPQALLDVVDDSKSRLQELAQARGLGLPSYRVTGRAGPPHQLTFTAEVTAGSVTASGSGPSKQAAEQEAAALALRDLGEDEQ